MSLAMLGVYKVLSPTLAKELEAAVGKAAVVWLEGQDCAGCSESFLNSLEPPATQILLDTISLRYHETVMAAAGHQADEALHKTVEEGGYVLVIEGSIPMAEDGLFCTVSGKPFKDIVRDAASNAAVIVPVGACASYGGIPRSGPTDAVGFLYRGTQRHGYFDDVAAGKPVINLPTCPVHPERLVAVLIHYLTFGTAPKLDNFERPVAFYGPSQHENCERRGHFDAGRFLVDWEAPEQRDWCLYMKGCKGPFANHDCWKRFWNSGTSYCIKANTPCVGCSEPEFYETFSPIYERQFDLELPGVGRVDVDKVMTAVTGAAAIGAGSDMVISRLRERRNGDKEEPTEGK